MTEIKRCWRPQGRFLREFARTGSVSAAYEAGLRAQAERNVLLKRQGKSHDAK